jgi:hypothetical protein
MIKHTFKDMLLPYKHFLHWNISKILFFIYWIFIWILTGLPFIIIAIIIVFSTANSSFLVDLIVKMFISLAFFFTTVWYFYNYLLLFKLNISYLNWKKMHYFLKSSFLNFKLYWKYLLLGIFLVFITFIIPSVVFTLLFFILIVSFWGYNEVLSLTFLETPSSFVILALLLFILYFVSIGYLIYRFIFSYVILAEYEKKWIFHLLKESFLGTKWIKKLFSISIIFFIISLVFLMIMIIENTLWFQENNNIKYIFYIINFIFLWWLVPMILTSFYYRKIKK